MILFNPFEIMFRGRFGYTVDGKGRLSIPAKFRDVLLGKGDERIMITNFVVEETRCLDVYPLDEWLRLEEEIRKKPKFERKMVMFQNYYLGGACECAVDKQGRILIPPLLRKYADLKRDVVLIGALEKFRIWDQEAWTKIFNNAEEKFTQDPDLLGDLGL
ncbi:MAG TPA: division/cell wall cluster transcriptional repressor MraZ [Candidatus Udaeobacter sp.]|nr:division/cell wall cluster transcriptional repressor MraZ [Candidatus Udaeobacter sp.]